MATLGALMRNRRWRWSALAAAVATIAIAVYSRGPHTARAWTERGDADIRRGRTEAAILEYRSAARLAPGDIEIHRKLGDAYLAMDDLHHAYDEYTRIGDLAPSNLEARLAAGRVLLASGDVSGARERARDVLARAPNHRAARLLLDVTDGRLLVASGNRANAAAEFREAVAIAPNEPEPHVLLGEALLAGGDRDGGLSELLTATRLAPDDELVNRAMGWYYITIERPREAEPYLRRAATRSTDRYHSALALADYLLAARRTDDAKRVLEHITGDDAPQAEVRLSALTSRWASGPSSSARP